MISDIIFYWQQKENHSYCICFNKHHWAWMKFGQVQFFSVFSNIIPFFVEVVHLPFYYKLVV